MHVTVCSHCFLQQDRASRPVMGERQQSRRINSELHDISDFIWRLLLAFTNQKPTSLATMLANACLPRLAACCSFQHCRNHDLCSVHVACLIDTQAVSPPLRELTLLCLVNPVVVNLLLCVKPIFTGRLPSCAWKHTTGPLLDLG